MNGQEYEKVVQGLGNFYSRMRCLGDKSRLSRLGSIVDLSKHRWRPLFKMLWLSSVILVCSHNHQADRVRTQVELHHLTISTVNLKPITIINNSYVEGNLLVVETLWQPFTRFESAIYQNKLLSPVSFLNGQIVHCGLQNCGTNKENGKAHGGEQVTQQPYFFLVNNLGLEIMRQESLCSKTMLGIGLPLVGELLRWSFRYIYITFL